jgi:predicted HicB family RNase H-like nuclease
MSDGEAMTDGPKRAKKGSIDSAVLVRLPDELRGRADRAAKKQGLSLAEWIRRAMAAFMGRK